MNQELTLNEALDDSLRALVSNSNVNGERTTPKRPHNAFNLFFLEQQPKFRAENPTITGNAVSRLLGQKWKAMSPEAKLPYKQKADELMTKFRAENPDYHYQKVQKKIPAKKIDELEFSPQIVPNPLEFPNLFSTTISSIKFESLISGGQVSWPQSRNIAEAILIHPDLCKKVMSDFKSPSLKLPS